MQLDEARRELDGVRKSAAAMKESMPYPIHSPQFNAYMLSLIEVFDTLLQAEEARQVPPHLLTIPVRDLSNVQLNHLLDVLDVEYRSRLAHPRPHSP